VQDIGEQPALAESAAKFVPPIIASTDPSLPSSAIDPATTIIHDHAPRIDGDQSTESAVDRKTTTGIRAPLIIPSNVHVAITAENLLEYVGPPMYQKDRIYQNTSPVGVSCGLGYLGNGSGAVMPIEVTVRSFLDSICML
jgi:Lon-like ATP-dependent protease